MIKITQLKFKIQELSGYYTQGWVMDWVIKNHACISLCILVRWAISIWH